MSPAELADRIGHTPYAVEGSAVDPDGRVKIDLGTRRLTLAHRSMELIKLEVQPVSRLNDGRLAPGGMYDSWRTAGEARVMAMHLRHVAAEWERAADVADALASTKPAAAPEKPRRFRRRENARFERIEMDDPAATVASGE